MLICLSDVQYTYPGAAGFVLGPLTLSLDTTRVTALIGSNGSGKTTLIKVILNEFVNYSGTYTINNKPVRDLTGGVMRQYGIGYGPEFPVLEERLTGLETMHLLKDIHGISDSDFATRLEEFRETFHLEEWFSQQPCRAYSQGMRKKVSLMIALIAAPPMVIVDEPTNGLDPIAVFGLKKLLARRHKEGNGALISSHMLDFVERVADDVVIVNNGHIAYTGTVSNLFSRFPDCSLDEIYYRIFTGNPTETFND